MLSKRTLGVGYLIAVGLGLFGSLTTGLLWPANSPGIAITPNAVLVIVAGLTVSGGFTLSGIRLANSKLAGERVWRVAIWSTVGLGVPTVLIVLLAAFHRDALEGLGWRSVAMINIAGGGVVGILIGTLTELRAELNRSVSLNQRNIVFLRLFRHDIRNSATSILGHLDLLKEDTSTSDRSIEVIQNGINHIVKLSEAARQLDTLDSQTTMEPVDLVALIRDLLEDIQASYPEAAFETDIPRAVTVRANDQIASVLDNVLRNAIEHNDGQPVIQVTITPSESNSGCTELRIEDNGPGFSEDELAVHTQANETALRHSDGIDLWLARWIVDFYGGDFSVANAETGGAKVTMNLPTA